MNNRLPLDAYKEAFLIVSTGKDSSSATYNTLGTLNQAAWLGERAGVMIAEIERLQAQVEELQKDKLRLDWIEQHRVQLNCVMGAPGNFHYSVGSWPSEHCYRAAIDKRMEQTK